MINLYDMLGLGVDSARLLAWVRGEPCAGLQRLSSAEVRMLAASWHFRSRPGQRWAPGAEFITDHQAGRGWGKSLVGGESIGEAASDPERWGGAAYVGGVEPLHVLNYCLQAKESGLFAVIERRERAGLGPGLRRVNLNNRVMEFDAPRGGGGGLTVYWGASSDPKSVRGPNYGLAWLDEFGVMYHRKTDEQGTNMWDALIPAMRAGPLPRIIITQTPSRAPEVRALQADAERPECRTCRAAYIARQGRYLGDKRSEPWRLPRSEQRRLHPLLDTRTTIAERVCPVCGGAVIARVRIVFGATTDNPMIAAEARDRATDHLSSGSAASRQEYAPRGEVDSGTRGTLVQQEHIERIHLDISPRLPDRYAAALANLGAEDVVVWVDPAVTAGDGSDDSGVGAACLRRLSDEGASFVREQVIGLQDWSVRPDEVDSGAPSSVWAPRAYWLALCWGARRIIVETNNGGEEALALIRGLVSKPPTEAAIASRLAAEGKRPAATFGAAARRMRSVALALQVEAFTRRGSKTARWGWYGVSAERKEQALLCVDWTGGAQAWATVVSQLVNFEPPQKGGAGGARTANGEKRDRADWLIAAAQVLLNVRETSGGDVSDPRADDWLSRL